MPERKDELEAPAIKLLYIVPRFPVVSQTFVLTELTRVRQQVPTEIAALFHGHEPVVHRMAAEVLPSVHFMPLWAIETLRQNILCLLRVPVAYLSTLLRVILGSARRPAGGAARGVIIFVKAVGLLEAIRRMGVTHVHAHFAHHPATAAWVIHRLTGLPFSMTAHADDLFCGPALLSEKSQDASAVVAISDYNRCYLREQIGDAGNVHVIHCGIDIGLFSYRERQRVERFICVARLEPKKGHSDLLQAFAQASMHAPTLYLDLVGDGAERKRLAALCQQLGISDRVRFYGALRTEKVSTLLAECDAFILAATKTPFRSLQQGHMDGVPVSLMEAMASGLPVISTVISGVPELVTDRAGILVSPGDVPALAAAMLRLHRDPGLAASLARQGRRRVERRYNADLEAARLVMLFEAIATKSRASGAPYYRR